MMELTMNQLGMAAGVKTPFEIGMPTPGDPTMTTNMQEELKKKIKEGPCPFDIPGGPPGLGDALWIFVQLGWV